jgi:hypothetical protein
MTRQPADPELGAVGIAWRRASPLIVHFDVGSAGLTTAA